MRMIRTRILNARQSRASFCAFMDAGRIGLAIAFAERAEALETHASTLMLIAQGKANAGETDAALDRCRTVLQMLPGSVSARLLMAQALESAVRTDEATEVLESLLREVRGKDVRVEAQVQHLRAAVLVHQKRDGEAVELLDASGPAYDVNGLFARIETAEGVVRVRFMKADRLEAPAGVLADDATVSVTTFEELRENVLSSLVRQAVLLNVREPGSGAV
jgi:hypothetical protein